MAWIETVTPEAASPELAELYRAIGAARGGIPDVQLVQSLNPRALRAHLELYKAVVFARSPLSRTTRERIAVAVSAANGCLYCTAHHGEALRQLGDSPAVVDALTHGEEPTELPAADRAVVAWATKATRAPASATEADLAALRAAGLDDRALLDATLTVAYFSFVNRLVLLLGVDVEEGFEETCGDPGDGWA